MQASSHYIIVHHFAYIADQLVNYMIVISTLKNRLLFQVFLEVTISTLISSLLFQTFQLS